MRSTRVRAAAEPREEPGRLDDRRRADDGLATSYLSTLAQEAGVDVPEALTKAQASKMIDELQAKTGRGR